MANPNETSSNQTSRRALVFLALGSALILGVGLASFRLIGPQDDSFDDVTKVALKPTGHTQPDDFFGSLDVAAQDNEGDDDAQDDDGEGNDGEDDSDSPTEITERIAILEPFAGTSSVVTTSLSGSQAVGTEPGLYGGNRQMPACDVEMLLERLDEDVTKALAWSAVLGIDSDSDDAIADYVDDLTSVRLRLDTRVTSHGFTDARATRSEAILQSGTAVLVDDTGVPRVACNSGNPLTEPESLGSLEEDQAFELDSIAEDPELAWLGLDPAEVVTVTPADEAVDAFVIVNIDDGGLLERPTGTHGESDLGTGDFHATLRWDSSADLDLEVIDPNETKISHQSPSPASSKGRLDVDANSRCEEPNTGVENVFWPDGDAPSGEYQVIVRGFAVGEGYAHDCGGNTAEYTLTIKVFGQEDQVHEGSIGDGETNEYSVTIM